MPDPTPALPKPSRAAAAKLRKRAERLAPLVRLLGDPTRLRLVVLLGEGERGVSSLHPELGLNREAVSSHIALLRDGGAIVPRREGKHIFYSLTPLGESLVAVALALM